ncbi:hypothetical protein, partial [Streptomyces sp. NPDC029704]|uniref:hypothetical protein n=1 Tax=Streptomyces sp. NPDC029704 TaxID=3156920 RepID=UPI003402E613
MLGAAAEILGWWAGLTALWAVLISSLDPLDLAIGAAASLLAAAPGVSQWRPKSRMRWRVSV